jgi:hypothetical protein
MEHITYTRLRIIVIEGNKRVLFVKVPVRLVWRLLSFLRSKEWQTGQKLQIHTCAATLQKKNENNAKEFGPWAPEHFTPSHWEC